MALGLSRGAAGHLWFSMIRDGQTELDFTAVSHFASILIGLLFCPMARERDGRLWNRPESSLLHRRGTRDGGPETTTTLSTPSARREAPLLASTARRCAIFDARPSGYYRDPAVS